MNKIKMRLDRNYIVKYSRLINWYLMNSKSYKIIEFILNNPTSF